MISHQPLTILNIRIQHFCLRINGLKESWLATMTPVGKLQKWNTASGSLQESAKFILGVLTGSLRQGSGEFAKSRDKGVFSTGALCVLSGASDILGDAPDAFAKALAVPLSRMTNDDRKCSGRF